MLQEDLVLVLLKEELLQFVGGSVQEGSRLAVPSD